MILASGWAWSLHVHMVTLLCVDEILLPRYMNWSTNFRGLLFNERMAPFWLKHSSSMNGYCWWSKDELINDVLRWTPTHGHTNVDRPAKTYIHQLCEDTRCLLEDLPRAMADEDGWRKRVSRQSIQPFCHDHDEMLFH